MTIALVPGSRYNKAMTPSPAHRVPQKPGIRPCLLVLLGPTASGKTRLAVTVAERLGGEILSADSRQVYLGLDIGSGKDLAEYRGIPYHLIDIVALGCDFSLFDFVRHFCATFTEITQREHQPIMVGGSGMYIDAVVRRYSLVEVPEDPGLREQLKGLSMAELQMRLQQLRPKLHNTTDLAERSRLVRAIEIALKEDHPEADRIIWPEFDTLVYGLRWPREALRKRITQRLRARFKQGMIEEVEQLHASGIPWETLEFFGLEYRFIAWHLQGRINYNDLFQKLNTAIHQFAKRQETWFRRMEREGVRIHWLDPKTDVLEELLDHWWHHQ